MERHHLEVDVVEAAVTVDVLDARIGEMNVSVEVGQLALARPLFDLGKVSIRPTVAVGATAIALLQELLVLALQLVVQDNAFDPRAALLEALGLTLIGAEDLHVVLDLARLLQFSVEVLLRLRIATATASLATFMIATMRLEQIASAVGQDDRDISMAVDLDRTDQTLLAE